MVHSGAARAAVENMMRTLSIEWARFGIKTCALAAGQFDTETLPHQVPAARSSRTSQRTIPLGRAGPPEEMAWLVAYLASPGGRLLLRHDDHDRRRPRQLVRRLAARRTRRRVGRAAGRGAQAGRLSGALSPRRRAQRIDERPSALAARGPSPGCSRRARRRPGPVRRRADPSAAASSDQVMPPLIR